MTETEPKKDPFKFLFFFYEFDGERVDDALLVGGDDPSTASPLHLAMGINEATKIVIRPISGVTTASSSNYHFKLQFDPGILLQPEHITVEGDEWDLKVEKDKDIEFYLLWKKEEEFILEGTKQLELMLNGVMGTLATAVRASKTSVILSWEFKRDGITIIDVTAKAPGDSNPYNNTATETLDMIQRQGQANIPLYVGFFSSNRVLNTDNQESELKLRITNTSESPITFKYNDDATNRSQLIVALEVGDVETVPWALGTADQVNNVVVTIVGDQWQNTAGPTQVQVGTTVKALEWTFSPKSADFVLATKETLVVELSKIVTAHPTGTANLYLRSTYVQDYQPREFICPIEKAPLVFPDQNVGIGTTTPAEKLHIQGGNLRLDDVSGGGGEIRTWGPLVFRSDVDKSSDPYVAKFFKQDQSDPLMVLDKDGNLGIGTKNPKSGDTGKGTLHVTGDYYGNGHMWLHSTSGDGQNGIAYVQARDDSGTSTIALQLRTQKNGQLKEVMHLDSSGNVGIGTTTPETKLHVADGNAKIEGRATINGAATIGGDATIFGTLGFGNKNRQMLNLYGNFHGIGIQASTTYFRTSGNFAWFKGGSHNDGVANPGDGGSLQMVLNSSGNVGIGTTEPQSKLHIVGSDNTSMIVENANEADIQYRAGTGDNVKNWQAGANSNGWYVYDTEYRLFVENGGNVGIGTSNPTNALHVAGKIRVDEMVTWNNGKDDYDVTWNDSQGSNYNTLSREGSSIRYKQNVEPLQEDFFKILKVEAKQFQPKPGYGREQAFCFGYIAEELHEAGLRNLVIYDKDGQPDSISYKKIAIYVNEVVKAQQKAITVLRQDLEELKQKLPS